MTEDEIIYAAWRESEAYAIPMTKEGERKAEQRWYAFKKGWQYAMFYNIHKHVDMDNILVNEHEEV